MAPFYQLQARVQTCLIGNLDIQARSCVEFQNEWALISIQNDIHPLIA